MTVYVQGEAKPIQEVIEQIEQNVAEADVCTALDMEDEIPSALQEQTEAEKDLHVPNEPATPDSESGVSEQVTQNILRRWGNTMRQNRGGKKRDKVKAKAARRARKITRRNRK